jgi:hypothetical protein
MNISTARRTNIKALRTSMGNGTTMMTRMRPLLLRKRCNLQPRTHLLWFPLTFLAILVSSTSTTHHLPPRPSLMEYPLTRDMALRNLKALRDHPQETIFDA